MDRQISVDTPTRRTACAHPEWNLADSTVTPEQYYLQRRDFLRLVGLGLAASVLFPRVTQAEPSHE